MDFHGVYKYKNPPKRQRDRDKREKFLDRFRAPVVFVPVHIADYGASDPWSGPIAVSVADTTECAVSALRQILKK